MHFFGNAWNPKALSDVDLTGNGSDALMLIAANENNDHVAVQVRNPLTGDILRTTGYPVK